jgi:CopG family nickel-responsive transcriptional regulator
MSDLARIGVSLEADLLKKFDEFISQSGYPTRSEAIKSLINETLIKKKWENSNNLVAGAVIFVYNHHKRELVNKMLDIQHNFNHIIISVQHIHLDHHNCMETVIVKGKVKNILEFMTQVKVIKGIKHSDIIMTTTG